MYPFPLLGILGNAVVVGDKLALGEECPGRFAVVTGPRSDAHVAAVGLVGLASGPCSLILGLYALAGKCEGGVAVVELHEETEPSVRLAFAGLGDVPAVVVLLGKFHRGVHGFLRVEGDADEFGKDNLLGELGAARVRADCLNCVHDVVCLLVVVVWQNRAATQH